MGRFFEQMPQEGKPISMKGLAKGLRAMAYALEYMSVAGGRIDWSAFGAPTIVPHGEDGTNQLSAIDAEQLLTALAALETVTEPAYVLGKDGDGVVGWVETVTHASQHPE
jgi:hypothetical protein